MCQARAAARCAGRATTSSATTPAGRTGGRCVWRAGVTPPGAGGGVRPPCVRAATPTGATAWRRASASEYDEFDVLFKMHFPKSFYFCYTISLEFAIIYLVLFLTPSFQMQGTMGR